MGSLVSGPIVIYGGSFDPVHRAHEAMVNTALEQLQPEKILIVPCHIPPHKDPLLASNEHRLAMLELVFESKPQVCIDHRELQSDAPSYTVNTVKVLRDEFGPTVSLNFLLGGDSWSHFASWYQWEEILNVVNIVVASRPGEVQENDALLRYQQAHSCTLNELCASPFGAVAQLEFAELNIASKEIRHALAKGVTISALAPFINEKVGEYIAKHGLYRS